jgi:hypothetical protein
MQHMRHIEMNCTDLESLIGLTVDVTFKKDRVVYHEGIVIFCVLSDISYDGDNVICYVKSDAGVIVAAPLSTLRIRG